MPENLKSRAVTTTAAVFALAGMLSGCSTLPADSPIEPVNYRACLVTDGNASTTGLNESSLYSLNQAVVTFGIQKTIVESSPSKFAKNLDKLVKQSCNFITIVGARFTDLLQPNVESNPNINFLFITDEPEARILSADLSNLAVYRVDIYEAGLLAGHLAASITATRQIAVVCEKAGDSLFHRGVNAGLRKYDEESGTTTSANTHSMSVAPIDVYLAYRCQNELPGYLEAAAGSFKVVGFGRDFYFNPRLSDAKEFVAATIIPQAGARLFEAIAADLESEFIGGRLGSTVASFNNGGLVISQEHEVSLPAGELEKLQAVASDYEISLK